MMRHDYHYQAGLKFPFHFKELEVEDTCKTHQERTRMMCRMNRVKNKLGAMKRMDDEMFANNIYDHTYQNPPAASVEQKQEASKLSQAVTNLRTEDDEASLSRTGPTSLNATKLMSQDDNPIKLIVNTARHESDANVTRDSGPSVSFNNFLRTEEKDKEKPTRNKLTGLRTQRFNR